MATNYEIVTTDKNAHIKVYNYKLFKGDGRINFVSTKANTLIIKNCSYIKKEKAVGTKIEIEIVKNGYILKRAKETMVATDNYDYKNLLEELSQIQTIMEVNFKDKDWPDLDKPELLIKINAEYKHDNK